MRISDWSSDVCSSDLSKAFLWNKGRLKPVSAPSHVQIGGNRRISRESHDQGSRSCERSCSCSLRFAARSEEHTSELQSLMRISYAVFCLKKKNTICI